MLKLARHPFLMLFTLLVFVTACEPEDPDGGEEEIDTVRLIINGQNIDWEVDGTDPTVTLDANQTISVQVEFWNLAEGENVTEEVREEDDEHFVCYTVTDANLTVARTDSDGTYEIGLASDWTTGDASTGVVAIELRHQPDVKDGTCTPGDTDVLATFNVTIQ